MKKKRSKHRKRSRRKKKKILKNLSVLFDKASEKVFNLPPLFFYIVLASICVLMFSLSWMGEENEHETAAKKRPINTEALLGYDQQPQPVVDRPELYDGLEASAGEDAKIIGQLNSIIFRLEKNIAAIVDGNEAVSYTHLTLPTKA